MRDYVLYFAFHPDASTKKMRRAAKFSIRIFLDQTQKCLIVLCNLGAFDNLIGMIFINMEIIKRMTYKIFIEI